MINSRNEKKRPTVKGSPVLAEGAAESVTKWLFSELTNAGAF